MMPLQLSSMPLQISTGGLVTTQVLQVLPRQVCVPGPQGVMQACGGTLSMMPSQSSSTPTLAAVQVSVPGPTRASAGAEGRAAAGLRDAGLLLTELALTGCPFGDATRARCQRRTAAQPGLALARADRLSLHVALTPRGCAGFGRSVTRLRAVAASGAAILGERIACRCRARCRCGRHNRYRNRH